MTAETPLLAHEPLFDGKCSQRGGIVEVQLLHEIRAVFLDGLQAKVEKVSDLSVLVPFGNQLQHFPFPRGKGIP